MPYRCKRCESTHDSRDNGAQHAWKTKDSDHEDVNSLEDGRDAVEKFDPNGESDDGEADETGDPTVSDGPPEVPDEPDDTLEAPCGHAFSTEKMEDGQTYRCTECDVRFTYHE